MSLSTFEAEIARESTSAREKHEPFVNFHEAYAVLLEEVDEFWDSVKRDDPDAKELIQIGAMCRTIWKELFGYPVQNHPADYQLEITGQGPVTNILNPAWLRANVGRQCRFPSIECLASHLKKLQHQGETSFAGGPLHQEIYLVDVMMTDKHFRQESFSGV